VRQSGDRRVSRRDFARLLALGGAGLLAGACAAPLRPAAAPASRSPSGTLAGPAVKLGAVFPLTGRWADFARKNTIALELAVEEINARGGIEGVRIRVTLLDDASEPETAAELVRTLATDEEVLAILGPFSSSEAEAAFPVANQLGVPVIAQASSKQGLGRAHRPWAFRSHVDEVRLAMPAVRKWVELYNVRSAAVVHDTFDAVSENLGSQILPAVARQHGVTIVNEGRYLTFVTNDVDYKAQVASLRELQFDGILFGGVHPDGARFLAEMRKQKLPQMLVGGSPLFNDSFLRHGGTAVNGTIVPTSFYSGLPDPQVQEWVARFRERARAATVPAVDPDFGDVNVYNCIYLLADLIQRLGVTNRPEDLAADREKIMRGLSQTKDWPGLAGTTGFNDDGDGLRPVYVLRAQDGHWVRLTY
jgi:branched-chain amino acid transport system substrate-binding protein